MTTIEPFPAEEARDFLRRARGHRLYALWVVVLMLGLRRSEVCGLHWSDVDLDNATLRVSRGLQRVNGSLRELPTKTRRSRRTVPLPPLCIEVLKGHRDRQAKERAEARRGWIDTPYMVTSTVDTSLEPRTLTRTFHALCDRHGPRRVRLHDLRHNCVSLLLTLGIHPRVVMEIVWTLGNRDDDEHLRPRDPAQPALRSTYSTRSSATTRKATNDPRCCQLPLSARMEDH